MPAKILLVEDDNDLAQMISDFLSDEGFALHWVSDGTAAIEAIAIENPDLVLLDVMLPGANGIEVVRRVRPDYCGIIVMLTAKNDEITEVNSLNRGADAFLEKPVRPHVLLAHIKAQLRRTTDSQQLSEYTLCVHGLYLDKGRQEAFLEDEILDLTTAEFELLAYFMENAGNLVTRNNLYQNLRNIEYDGMDRAMDMRISTLRKKMNDEHPPYRYIKTVRGKGYVFAR